MDQPAHIRLSAPKFASTPYGGVEGRLKGRKIHNGISTSSVQLTNGYSEDPKANGSFTQSPQVDIMSRSERLPISHRFSGYHEEKLSVSRTSHSQLLSELDQTRSFWTAVKEDYEYVMGEHLVEEYRETSMDAREREFTEKLKSLMDLFSENCSRLHHDICDAIRDLDDLNQDGFDKLYLQYNRVRGQAELLKEKFPVLGEEVGNRLLVVDRIFEQMEAKLLARHDIINGEDNGNQSGLNQLRKWLQSAEFKLQEVDQHNDDWMFDLTELNKALDTVREIHDEIKRDGGSLVNSLEKSLRESGCEPHSRRLVLFQGLERRWHALFLLSLEWQYWLEEQIQQVKSGNFATLGSDSEDEPNKKKRRLSDEYQSSESEENNIDERQPSEKHSIYGNYLSCPRGIRNGLSESQHSDAESYISDTLPFPDREYEKIVISTNHSREFIVSDTESEGEEMDFNGNDLADSSGSTVKTPTWPNEREKSDDVDESPRVDICLKLKNSPSKVYYQTALCDVEGCANAGNHCGEHSLAPQFSNGTSSTGTSTSISAPLCYVKTIPFGNPIERKGERKVANAEEIQLTTSQHEFMTDSMTVNVDEQSDFDLNISQDYQEVLEELGNQEGWDALTAQLRQMAEGKGTTWRAFSGSKKSLTAGGHVYAFGRKSLETIPSVPDTPRAPDELLNETGEVPRDTQPVYSSCDASGEMSNEEDAERSYEGRLMEPQSKMELPVTDATTPVSRNGSLKRRRRRRMERPLSLSGQRILTSLLNAEPLMTASFHEGRQAGHSVFHSDYSNSRRLLDGSGDIWDYSNSHRMSRSMNTSSSATGSHVWGAEGLATPTPSLDNVLLTSSGYGEDFPAIQSENCSPVRHSRMTSSVTLPAGLKYVCEGSPKHLLDPSRPSLKAHRRMTRSMSGCDHFLRRTRDLFTSISSLNRKKASGLERSSEPVSTEAHFNTPAISIKLLPTVSLASDLNCTRDNFPTIAQLDQGETHSHSDSMGSPLPERLRGDGGSITGPEQSEGIWEWDDYKPPEHNECGMPDKALDGTSLIDFGDDYRQFLGSQSDSNCASFKLKFDGEKLESRSPLRYKRLPIGTSQDSDSELEELHRIVKESRGQLKMVQNRITDSECQSSETTNMENSYPVLLKICERNIQVLRTVFPECGKVNREIPEYVALAGLLADWEAQLFQLQQHPTINRVVVGCEANSSQQSPSTDSMPVCKIRSEISSLRDTLEEVTQKGKKYWEISTETDLDEAIQFFTKSVNLLRERKQLIPQLIDYNDRRKDPGQSDMSKEEIKEDLVGCQLLYDEAADRFTRGLHELQHQRRSLNYWHQTAEVLSMKIDGITSRLDNLENSADTDMIVEQKMLASDFSICQDRLTSLERFCNGISGQNNDLLISELHCCQENFLKKMESLRDVFLTKVPGEMNNTVECASMSARKRPAMVVKPLEETMEVEQLDCVDRVVLKEDKRVKKQSRTALKTVWRLIKASWPIQLCFLVLVVVGAYSMQPGGCENQNNWRHAWGPQLDHVRGPPPS